MPTTTKGAPVVLLNKIRLKKRCRVRSSWLVLITVLACFSAAANGQTGKTLAGQTDGGVEFDRAVAVVNGKVILDSDVDQELRFESLNRQAGIESGITSSTVSPNRDEAIERLIDRELILKQIKLQNEADIPDATVDDQIKTLRQNLPACAPHQCDTEAGWNKFLQTQGFTAASFHDYWKERIEALSFIEERFRSGIRIDPVQVSEYYKRTFVPQYRKSKLAVPPLEKVQDRIETLLVEQEVSKLLDDWLQALRSQGGVVILHPGQVAP